MNLGSPGVMRRLALVLLTVAACIACGANNQKSKAVAADVLAFERSSTGLLGRFGTPTVSNCDPVGKYQNTHDHVTTLWACDVHLTVLGGSTFRNCFTDDGGYVEGVQDPTTMLPEGLVAKCQGSKFESTAPPASPGSGAVLNSDAMSVFLLPRSNGQAAGCIRIDASDQHSGIDQTAICFAPTSKVACYVHLHAANAWQFATNLPFTTDPTKPYSAACYVTVRAFNKAGASGRLDALQAAFKQALQSPRRTGTTHSQPASSSTHLGLPDCRGTPEARPREIVVTCADAGVVLESIQWKTWGGTAAKGRATLTYNDCAPSCAGGHFHSQAVAVTVEGRQTCPNGQTAYRSVAFRPTPRGWQPKAVTLPCLDSRPTSGSAAKNLVATPQIKTALRAAFLASHPQLVPTSVTGPILGKTYYGSSGSTLYALAVFSLPKTGETDQPEAFMRPSGKAWIDKGETGGCLNAMPATLLHVWRLSSVTC
jgi:hypothetical protein